MTDLVWVLRRWRLLLAVLWLVIFVAILLLQHATTLPVQ